MQHVYGMKKKKSKKTKIWPIWVGFLVLLILSFVSTSLGFSETAISNWIGIFFWTAVFSSLYLYYKNSKDEGNKRISKKIKIMFFVTLGLFLLLILLGVVLYFNSNNNSADYISNDNNYEDTEYLYEQCDLYCSAFDAYYIEVYLDEETSEIKCFCYDQEENYIAEGILN